MTTSITNFGGNVRFHARHFYAPENETDVLEILDRHAHERIRVVGSKHSWNEGLVCDQVILTLHHFNKVVVESTPQGVFATVGGGCKIARLLQQLHYAKLTLPSVGLIAQQTIAGAISTATHGSGRPSLSHYLETVRLASFDPQSGKARIDVWDHGTYLHAARCAVGCLGVVLSVQIRCRPIYDVEETIRACASLEEVLAGEGEFPLQQFFLVPHRWNFYVQRRREMPGTAPRRNLLAALYRMWWWVAIDVGLHLVIKALLLPTLGRWPRRSSVVPTSGGWIRWFYRRVLPWTIPTGLTVVDRSERMLIMKHELFRHLEMEVFVPEAHLSAALAYVRWVLEIADGARTDLASEWEPRLRELELHDALSALRSTYSHHYPIAVRKVLTDDTLLSMSSGGTYYAISLITYAPSREPFLAVADFLAPSMARLFGARPHWGKYFPLCANDVERLYPKLPEFQGICRAVDRQGAFRNDFANERIFGKKVPGDIFAFDYFTATPFER